MPEEAIMCIENAAEPLGSCGSGRTPQGATSLPKYPAGGEGSVPKEPHSAVGPSGLELRPLVHDTLYTRRRQRGLA